MNSWFDIDKDGLSKLLENKGKSFAIFELVQNAWDEEVTKVNISLSPIKNRSACKLIVIDNSPEGFKNIYHAFTLFAESEKKKDPTKRGRFNIGEKLVLACCEEATITTTTGTVYFSANGQRSLSKNKRPSGSKFEATIKMTRQEFLDVCEQMSTLIPPENVSTIFNDKKLIQRNPVKKFEAILPTEISDEEGRLKKTKRKTIVKLYEVFENETPHIYEMGIPVVDFDNKFHVDIQQKVPLNFNRDNVTPSYLKELYTVILNESYSLLEDEEEISSSWVNKALEGQRIKPEAVQKIIGSRFGKKAVSYDPSDLEGTKISTSKGYTVVYGGTFNKKQWDNIKKANVLPPAGQVTPSPKPYSKNGKELKLIPKKDWDKNMVRVAEYAKLLAKKLMNVNIHVRIANNPDWNVLATYGGKELTLNKGKLGCSFFNDFPKKLKNVNKLLIHEFGHEYSDDHLSSEFHDSLCMIGAKLAELALSEPELFLSE